MVDDLRYAFRTLRRAPGFTAMAALTLALGIGANTAIFSVIHAVLLRPLAFNEPHRLVSLREGRADRPINISYLNFLDWRARNAVFEDMAICLPLGSSILTGHARAEVVPTARTEGRLFRVLGVPLVLGRTFAQDEEKPGSPAVALISSRLWERRFNRAPDAVGRQLTLDGAPVTVVGVLSPEFRLITADVLFPLGPNLRRMDLDRGNHPGFFAYARLRDGVDVARAQREMSSIAADLERQYPATNTQMGVLVMPMADWLLGNARPMLLLLASAVALLLLIACANVANVLLARGLRRERETAVRNALGAGRWRIVRLFLCEGLAIALIGSLAGVLIASWAVRALRGLRLALPRVSDIAVNTPVVGYAMLLAAATVLIFALAPALHLSRVDVMRSMRQAGSATGGSRATRFLRTTLVVVEVALSLMLLVGAGQMLRTMAQLIAVSPGYDSERVLAVGIAQSDDTYADDVKIAQFAERLVDEVRTIPGVADAAVAFALGPNWTPKVVLPGHAFPRGQEPAPFSAAVSPGFFSTMGIPVKRGRVFNSADRSGAPVAAVVNETFVRQVLGGADPMGQRLSAIGIPQMAATEIVGVVGDTRRLGLSAESVPELYVSYAQMPVSYPTLVVRSVGGDPMALVRAVDERVASIDPNVPTVRPRRLSDDVAGTISNRRGIAVLLGLFAVVALGLTGLGIASVVSYVVAQRTQEIGVRIALGAEPGMVRRLIVRGAMTPVLAGLGIGALAAFPFSRLIRSFLYNVAPFDPVSVGLGAGVLLLAALVAAYVPARRATRIDPLAALRAM